MRPILLTLLLCGCTVDDSGLVDGDLGAQPVVALCTSAACASAPCTQGCIFTATTSDHRCPGASPVDAARVEACSGWCGLQTIYAEGCLRYRDEDPHCPDWCVAWGDASCWERTPDIDYATGGAICPSQSSCFGGYPSEDASAGPCVDAGPDL